MDKGTIKRLIIWATLLIIFVTLSILGIVKYYQGYGKYGSIRKELLPIVDIFNSLNIVNNSDWDLTAKISNDQIIVNYIDDTSDIKYYFKYSNDKLLNLKYNAFYTKSATIVVEAMIDSISIYNGNNEGDVFKKYKLTDFYNSNINYGVKLTNDGKYVVVDLDISKNIILNLNDVVLTPMEVTYITINDIPNIKKDLVTNTSFKYTKNDISIFVTSDSKEYTIYANNNGTDKKVLYESIMTTISLLNTNVYDEIISNGINFDSNIEKLKFNITLNPTIDENTIEIDKNNLVKVTIKK